MLTSNQLVVYAVSLPYICPMTFKELANELMDQGWRAYHIQDVERLTRGNTLQALSIRKRIEVVTYDDHKVIFVKTIPPPSNPRPPKMYEF